MSCTATSDRSDFREWLAAKFSRFILTILDMWSYQKKAVDFLEANPFCQLFIDLGLGKTVICLTLIVRLMERFAYNKVLVIAPLRVAAQTWPNEIPIWEHTSCIGFTVIRAEDDEAEVLAAMSAAGKAARLEAKGRWDVESPEKLARYYMSKAKTAKKEEIRLRRMNSKESVHIINREQLEWLVDQYSEWKPRRVRGVIKYKRIVKNWPYDVVIVDESSSFKDITSNRFKALAAVRPFLKRLHMLTATPASESLMALFAQTYLLDLGKRFGRYISKYRADHFDYNEYANTYKIKPGHSEIISEAIADISLVMTAKEYLPGASLYEPIYVPRRLIAKPKEMDAYNSFVQNFVFELPKGGVIEAKTAGVLAQKLLQLSSGAIYDEDKVAHLIHDHVLGDLEELVEEMNGRPLLVAYWHKSSLKRLQKHFPQGWVMDKKGSRIKDWNDGKIPLMFVHPASVGHGLNMQYGPGHAIYWFEPTYSRELYDQLIGRLARQGQKLRVLVYTPRVQGTAHDIVYRKLDKKLDAQNAMFRYIRQVRDKVANDNLKMRQAA